MWSCTMKIGQVACGSFLPFPIDFNLLADGFARQITEIMSKQLPSIMRRKIVFCGLPVSVGAKHLAIAPETPHEDVLRTLHETAVSFATREHAPYIVFKEFPAEDCPTMRLLAEAWVPAFLVSGDEHIFGPVL